MKSLTAADRKNLIRLASSLPKGDKSRRAILAGLKSITAASKIEFDDFAEYEIFANEILSTVLRGLNKVSKMEVIKPQVVFGGRMVAAIVLNKDSLLGVNYNPKNRGLSVSIDYKPLMMLAEKYEFPRDLFSQRHVQVGLEKSGGKVGKNILMVLSKEVPPELGILKGTKFVPPSQSSSTSAEGASELRKVLQKIEADIDRENPEIDYDFPNKWFEILEENKGAIESAISKLGPADAKNALKTLREGGEAIFNTGYKHAWDFLYALDADDEVEMEMTPFEDQGDIDRAMKEVDKYKAKAEKMFKDFQSSIKKK